MDKIDVRPSIKLMRMPVMAIVVAISLALSMTVTALANTVNIYDRAGVLNVSQVRSAASSLPYNIDIYTISNFSGSSQSFDQTAANEIKSPNLIVIAIGTNIGHMAVTYGRNVPLGNGGSTNAKNAFISNYQSNHSYTSATIASINALNSSLGGSSSNNNNGSNSNSGTVPAAGGFFNFGSSALCCIGLLVILGIAFFAITRRRGGIGGLFNRAPNYNQFNQPYQGNYPPQTYGPGYPQQNQGMNPWAAGGLGAAAGGLVGYELGKEQGERQDEQQGNQGGNFGGGSSGDFGQGNQGGDFGGGSSGDFGGGSSGDFGGGSGGDFGGGSGGNF